MSDGSETDRLGAVLERIGRGSASHTRVVLAVVLLLVGVAAVGVVGVQMSMGMELYLEDDSETIENWDELQDDFNAGNVVFAVVETDDGADIFDPAVIEAVDELTEEYERDVEAAAAVTSYTQLLSQDGELPETRSEAVAGLAAIEGASETNEQILGNLVPDYGEENATAIVQLQYGSTEVPADSDDLFGFMPPSENEVVIDQITAATDSVTVPEGTTVTITGGPVFEEAAFGLMLPEMITLFGLAFAVILLTMTLVMRGRLRKTRRVSIPLTTTMVALFVMVGMMGFVGFDFNAIMLGVMPVALGLGIDYGLQIQTRYVEERENGRVPVDAAGIAARTAGRSLTLALGTTLVGLGSLLAAEVPPVRQFGVTAAFSVLTSMALSLTLLIALLRVFDDGVTQPAETADDGPAGAIERAVGGLGGLITARPLAVVLVFGLVIAGGFAAYPMVQTQDNMFDYWPDIQEKDDLEELEASVGSPNLMYVVVEGEDIYNSEEQLAAVSEFEEAVTDRDHVVTSLSPVSAIETQAAQRGDEPVVSTDPQERQRQFDALQETDIPPVGFQPFTDTPDRLLVQLYVEDVTGDQEADVIESTDEAAAQTLAGMDARVSGNIVINRNVIDSVTAGLTRTTLLSFGAGLVFLGLALRSARESIVLVGSVAASTMALVAGGMYLVGVPWNPLTVTTASIVFGVGITYGIHVYERFREELAVSGASPAAAIQAAITAKARPVLGSGATTMFGFGVLIVSDFPVLSNFGLAIALAMGLALISAFVFMPAVVLLLTRLEFVPAGATQDEPDRDPEIAPSSDD